MKKTGFIGLGIMGRPMAENLLKAGCELYVYDVSPAAVERLTALGAKASDPAGIGRNCDVIFLSLPNGSISQSVLFGDNGVASTVCPGAIVCDTSSVTPSEAQTCHEKLLEHGVWFVDSPVSGGEPGAIAGTLANQVIVNLTIAAVSEAFVLSTKAGADPWKVYKAIRGGLAGSAVLDAKIPMIVERNFTPGGKISINHKDIKNVLATAHEIDVPVPLSAQLFEIQQALKAHGHMDDDHCGYVQYFEALAGVTVKSDKPEE